MLLLALTTATASADDDCYGGNTDDPAHADQLALESFGTDWTAQISLSLLQDFLAERLSDPAVQPYLVWEGGFTILSILDVDYRYTTESMTLSLEDDQVVLDVGVHGHATIGSRTCDADGSLTIRARPEIEEASGEHQFALEDVETDLSDFPAVCGIGPGNPWFLSVESALESQIDLLLRREYFTVEDVVGIDGDLLANLDHDLGGFDPYDDMQLSVVEEETLGGPGFLAIGGQAAATEPCGSADYPLFYPDAFQSFGTWLGRGPVALGVSMRLVPVIAAQAKDYITDAIDSGLSDRVGRAGLGWLDVRFRHLTIWYSGLDHEKPCDCTTGDTEYWLDLDETDPKIGFRIFFAFSFKGFSIFGWDPGPVTLQLNGTADLSDGRINIDLHRANVYGPWWADTAAAVLKSGWGIDIQDAAFYQPFVSDIDTKWLPDSIETPLGTLYSCGVEPLLSAQVLSFSPGDCSETDSDSDGVSDRDELLLGTDAAQADTDGDGLSDAFEARIGCDPTEEDSDGDGLGDWVEYVRTGTDCTDADTDGDGATDGCEDGVPGMDPLDPDSDDDGDLDGREDAVTLGCP